MTSGIGRGLGCALVLILTAVPAAAYDVNPINSQDNTAVPDVDKAGIQQGQPVPPRPAADDNGCWAATASNLLGAAGWGINGTAQQKADQIYSDLVNAFKVAPEDTYIKAGGNLPAAAMWWVHNIGTDSIPGGVGYSPTNTYVNFCSVQKTLHESDYNFLLDLLSANQTTYVGVFWVTGGELGHNMTLVGGDYGLHRIPHGVQQQSVWHNSDNEGLNTNDEAYCHDWDPGLDPTWYLNMNGAMGNHVGDWLADGYFLVSQGVPKPSNAIATYDVHYYLGPKTPAGGDPLAYDTVAQMHTTGLKYGTYKGPGGEQIDPVWMAGQLEPTLIVPNEVVERQHKELYILVDFNLPLADPQAPDIKVFDDQDNQIPLDSSSWASDNGEVLLKYVFDNQPAWEKVVFPSNEYVDLLGQMGYNVLEWNLATECVPEPATMLLVVLGGGWALMRRRAGR